MAELSLNLVGFDVTLKNLSVVARNYAIFGSTFLRILKVGLE